MGALAGKRCHISELLAARIVGTPCGQRRARPSPCVAATASKLAAAKATAMSGRAATRRRTRGEGVRAELISRRFRAARARLGLDAELPPLRHDLFRVPHAGPEQLTLL